jgi:flavodoxin
MNVLIIYKSYHRMNTEKVAEAMAGVMNATLRKVDDMDPAEDLSGYDLIGFGSGIYGGKPHKSLMRLVENLPLQNRNVFIFSTAGGPQQKYHQGLRELLASRGCRIAGEFQCPGVFGPMWFSLVNKGHPDEQDLERAREFARGLMVG